MTSFMAWITAGLAALAGLFAALFGFSRSAQNSKTRKIEVSSRDTLIKRLREEDEAVAESLRRRKH